MAMTAYELERIQTKDWPRDCPKCGYHGAEVTLEGGEIVTYAGAFSVEYCPGRSQTLPCWRRDAWIHPIKKGEHLHHVCGRCGFVAVTYCVGQGPMFFTVHSPAVTASNPEPGS